LICSASKRIELMAWIFNQQYFRENLREPGPRRSRRSGKSRLSHLPRPSFFPEARGFA
jgi:hypothetical protein